MSLYLETFGGGGGDRSAKMKLPKCVSALRQSKVGQNTEVKRGGGSSGSSTKCYVVLLYVAAFLSKRAFVKS